MTSKELNKSKEEIDVLLENLKRVETILKAYKFDLESSREIICELEEENAKLKKAIKILKKISGFEDDFICGYDEYCNRYGDDDLTKEEYELVKEVMEDEKNH